MDGVHDKTRQIIKCAAALEIDKVLIDHGVIFIADGCDPLHFKFETNIRGEITGYRIDPVVRESKHVQSFTIVNAYPRKDVQKTQIIGVDMPKIFLPGEA